MGQRRVLTQCKHSAGLGDGGPRGEDDGMRRWVASDINTEEGAACYWPRAYLCRDLGSLVVPVLVVFNPRLAAVVVLDVELVLTTKLLKFFFEVLLD